MEEKINEIINKCFDKLRQVFEENGIELDYETQDYVEEMINKQYSISKLVKKYEQGNGEDA